MKEIARNVYMEARTIFIVQASCACHPDTVDILLPPTRCRRLITPPQEPLKALVSDPDPMQRTGAGAKRRSLIV